MFYYAHLGVVCMLFRAMLMICGVLWSLCLFEFEHKDHCHLRYWLFLTLIFAKKRGGKGLLCLNTSYIPEIITLVR